MKVMKYNYHFKIHNQITESFYQLLLKLIFIQLFILSLYEKKIHKHNIIEPLKWIRSFKTNDILNLIL